MDIEADDTEDAAAIWRDLQRERLALEQREAALIRRTLRRTHGVVAHAARALGIARTTLASRLERYGGEA